jgi:hypothetical protein
MTQVTQNKETEAFLIELFRAFFIDPVRFRTLTFALRSGAGGLRPAFAGRVTPARTEATAGPSPLSRKGSGLGSG